MCLAAQEPSTIFSLERPRAVRRGGNVVPQAELRPQLGSPGPSVLLFLVVLFFLFLLLHLLLLALFLVLLAALVSHDRSLPVIMTCDARRFDCGDRGDGELEVYRWVIGAA